MNAGLLNLLRRLVEKGKLTVVFSSGEKVVLGDGTGKPAAIRFADAGAEKAVLHDPGLKFGEMYMDGRVLVEEGDIFDVLAIVKSNDLDKAATFTNSIVALGHIFQIGRAHV